MYSAVHDLIIDSRDLRVFANGSGRPVLMLHDLGTSAACFEALTAPVVAADRELVAVDLPGCGHSDPVRGSELSAFVEHLVLALPRLSEEPIDLVGCGFGGYLAASIAATEPALVRRLVLSEPTIPPRSGPAARTRMPPGMAVSGALTTLRRGKLRQNLSGFARAKAVLDQLSQSDPGWWDSLSRIAAPTLILGSSEGEVADRALLDQLAGAIPGALRNTVAGGRRAHQSAPDDFAGHLMDFLAG